MEKTAKDPHTKDLKRLAEDEVKHVRLLNDILSHWEKIPLNEKDLDALDSGRKLRTLFSNASHPGLVKEIIEYALNGERIALLLYESPR